MKGTLLCVVWCALFALGHSQQERSDLDKVIDDLFSKPAPNGNAPNVDDVIKDVFGPGGLDGNSDPNQLPPQQYRPESIPGGQPPPQQPQQPQQPQPPVAVQVGPPPQQPVPSPDDQRPNQCTYGECVPYYLCENGTVITDGSGLLDIRMSEDNPVCGDVLSSCCALKSKEPRLPTVPINSECGIRNTEGVGFRITGDKDNEAQFGEFPWMVAVLEERRVDNGRVISVYVCGGSLIAKNVVLTAAHCVDRKDARTLKIRAGEWDTQTTNEIYPHQDRTVSEYSSHPGYYRGGLYNDVALVYLNQPVDITENVNIVCLPQPRDAFDGSRCFASGWGKDLFGQEGRYSLILKRVELPVVSFERCQNKLRETRLGAHYDLHSSFICAGGERGKDTCRGDGGSPLVCPIGPRKYVQAGIVSWGIGCGDDVPGVYANIAHAREWIDEQLRLKGAA